MTEGGGALRSWAQALDGCVSGRSVLAPGPGHSRQDRSLSVTGVPKDARSRLGKLAAIPKQCCASQGRRAAYPYMVQDCVP
jgi:hypothetical protein